MAPIGKTSVSRVLPGTRRGHDAVRHGAAPMTVHEASASCRTNLLFTMSDDQSRPVERPAANLYSFGGRAIPDRGPGGARRDRTDDLMLAKHALSQLSYGPVTRTIVNCVVGLGRLELPTSRLSGVRSNHLSYRPAFRRPRLATSGRRGQPVARSTCPPKKEKRRRRSSPCGRPKPAFLCSKAFRKARAKGQDLIREHP